MKSAAKIKRREQTRPDISVIIVNHNTRELLRECLLSIQGATNARKLQMIVVDNGSTDGSVELVTKKFHKAVLIRNLLNEGFARPNNQGLRLATGRYCLLLNSDTVVRPDALEKLVRFMDGHPSAGACGPRLVNPDGSLQPSCRSFPSLWRHFCDMSGLETFFPKSVFGNFETRFTYDRDAVVDQPMGAALLVRQDLIKEVGHLDERFKIYYNDVDWCYRARRDGWGIYFVHDAIIMHHGGKTTAMTNPSFEQFEEMNRNFLLYYEKYYGRMGVLVVKILMAMGFGARVFLWAFASMLDLRDNASYRLEFARRSFWIGLKFWTPSV